MWYEIVWFFLMIADIPRLIFRNLSLIQPLETTHRIKKYSVKRILFQFFCQNSLFYIGLIILFFCSKDDFFLGFFWVYLISTLGRLWHQIEQKSAYVTSSFGHFFNNFIIKPLRMLLLLYAAFKLEQRIWLIGFSIMFSKWILTLLYEKIFDVPNWYHTILIIISSLIVLTIYPFNLGNITVESTRSYFSLIPSIYSAYTGLLGVFLGLVVTLDKNEKTSRYFFSGMILNFSSASFLIILCLISLLCFSSSINLSPMYLFQSHMISLTEYKYYILFGIIFSFSILLFFFSIMTAYLMLLQAGNLVKISK